MGSPHTLADGELAAEALQLDPDQRYRAHGTDQRAAEQAFDQLNPQFGVPADQRDPLGQRAVRDREAALALGIRVAVHDSRQNDRDSVIWQAGQDYRAADAIRRARTRYDPTHAGAER
jgi:hypothetical protein